MAYIQERIRTIKIEVYKNASLLKVFKKKTVSTTLGLRDMNV
jgi:hypothetical protein